MAHFSLRIHLGQFNNSLKGTLASSIHEAKELGMDMAEFGSYGAAVDLSNEGYVKFYGMVEEVSPILLQ